MPTSSSSPLSKRKLDDYVSAHEVNQQNDNVPSTINSPTRMRKDDDALVLPPPPPPPHKARRPGRTQFFVRMLDKTLVLHADPMDTVRSVHEKVQAMTNIRAMEVGLVYRGKQLQWDRTLIDCGVEDDANLHVIGRMRSTQHPRAWQLINGVISLVFDIINATSKINDTAARITRICNSIHQHRSIKSMLEEYLSVLQCGESDLTLGYLQVFNESSAAAALVMLYTSSPDQNRRDMGDESIRYFVDAKRDDIPENNCRTIAPIVLEFCKLLRARVGADDLLYDFCRSNLGIMLSKCGQTGIFSVREILPFVRELAGKLSHKLSDKQGPSSGRVKSLADFLVPLRKEIEQAVVLSKSNGGGAIRMPLCLELVRSMPVLYPEEVFALHGIFLDLLGKMDECLNKVEEHMMNGPLKKEKDLISRWNQYLLILKELCGISKLYDEGDKQFEEVIKLRKNGLNHLVVNCAKRGDDNQWILQFKELTDFDARRHLAMMTLSDSKNDYFESLEMLIDRSQLLSESFEYIRNAQPQSLRSGLLMKFKNEKATGPGVLREWFFLVCREIFNPENALFVACPTDRRRFYPNPASKVHPLHLEYFKFSGRVVALALVHKVQVGIVFDRIFVAQLAGDDITLEDVRSADPSLYRSCKKILEMDAETVDEDVLGLTFVHEIEELGSRKAVELLPGGCNIVVNSKNREEYIDLLIRYRFVVSISEQVVNFARGFSDIASSNKLEKAFFRFLNTDDLDMMLHGSDKPICVDDWKAHTQYNGYEQSDSQISWFWEIVKSMSAEQRKVLLFFWTSLKYLPVEGFRGLASRLHIYKSSESANRLPTSHTCFYELCLPLYKSFSCMRERLHIITQEHVGCSFGAH